MPHLPANPPTIASPLTSSQRLEAKPGIHHVLLGDVLFRTWFPSFYPGELIGKELDRLYICQRCFKYTKEQQKYMQHVTICREQGDGPPGQLIYKDGCHRIYEVDGEEEQLFAQNLSLFAKLFLDNKSVFFDVASFNYYLLMYCSTSDGDKALPQTVGFFSKEKMSWDNNNLACILVFPPWQRKGLGKILMGLSYELSRREGRYGGPEKPLSELGRRGYMHFWEARVARTILSMKGKQAISISDLARDAWVLPEDVIASLKRMGVLGLKKKDASTTISKLAIREWVANTGVDLTPPIAEKNLVEDGVSENGDKESV